MGRGWGGGLGGTHDEIVIHVDYNHGFPIISLIIN